MKVLYQADKLRVYKDYQPTAASYLCSHLWFGLASTFRSVSLFCAVFGCDIDIAGDKRLSTVQ